MKTTWITTTAVLLIDQISKLSVLYGLNLPAHQIIDLWAPYLRFSLVWNPGMNFGAFAGYPEVTRFALSFAAGVIVAWVYRYVRRSTPSRGMQIFAGMLIGGAVGNVIDRIFHGSVFDFINVTCCGIVNPYSFNIADMAIVAGALGLALMPTKAHAK